MWRFGEARMAISTLDLGGTGLHTSRLGLGAGSLGDEGLTDTYAAKLLHTALDLGVRLIDTAPSYGVSEDRIGRHLAARRQEFVLSTKVGYGIDGVPDWTSECIRRGIDRALQRLRTEHIDIVLLHSCDLQVLQRGEVIDALERAKLSGKIGVAGYSGENEGMRFALKCGSFGCLETSINVCDQKGLDDVVPSAQSAGIGVIAKRPVANAPWRFAQRPVGHYAEEYWHRWKTMDIDALGQDWQSLALRFAVWHTGAHSCIVGTASIEHLRQNAVIVAQGPLPASWVESARNAFKMHGEHWHGLV